MGRKHYRNLVLAKDGIKINGSSMANDIQFATNDPDREKKKMDDEKVIYILPEKIKVIQKNSSN